jgi:hypothetical protein
MVINIIFLKKPQYLKLWHRGTMTAPKYPFTPESDIGIKAKTVYVASFLAVGTVYKWQTIYNTSHV